MKKLKRNKFYKDSTGQYYFLESMYSYVEEFDKVTEDGEYEHHSVFKGVIFNMYSSTYGVVKSNDIIEDEHKWFINNLIEVELNHLKDWKKALVKLNRVHEMYNSSFQKSIIKKCKLQLSSDGETWEDVDNVYLAINKNPTRFFRVKPSFKVNMRNKFYKVVDKINFYIVKTFGL